MYVSAYITYDVVETGIVQCDPEYTQYQLFVVNFTIYDIQEQGPKHLHVRESIPDGYEELATNQLQIHEFYFFQSSTTGEFTDYLTHEAEDPDVIDQKRSLVHDLNPVIGIRQDAQNKVAVIDGNITFALHEKTINGHHRSSVQLRRDRDGVHLVTEHVRQLLSLNKVSDFDTTEIEIDGSAEIRANSEYSNIREPPSCPYKVAEPLTTDPTSQQTIKTAGKQLVDVESDGRVSVGMKPRASLGPTKSPEAAAADGPTGLRPVHASQESVVKVNLTVAINGDSGAHCTVARSARRLFANEVATTSLAEMKANGGMHASARTAYEGSSFQSSREPQDRFCAVHGGGS